MDTIATAILDDCTRIQEFALDVVENDSPAVSNAKYIHEEITKTKWFDEYDSRWRFDDSTVKKFLSLLQKNDYYTTTERDSRLISSRAYSIQYTQTKSIVNQMSKTQT